MPRPAETPLGLVLARSAKSVSQRFDAALGAAGGSLPSWLVLLAVTTRQARNQRELAEVVGIQGATLTHHLNRMEADGLLTRRRDPGNRRVHLVELTPDGEQLFHRLAEAASAFNRTLHARVTPEDADELRRILALLEP